jgi:DNA repair photolyase
MAPLLPGLSDAPEKLGDVVRAAREAGACGIWANVLNLRPGTREHFLECLAQDWPDLLPEYERLYRGRAYVTGDVASESRRAVRELARSYGIRDRRPEPLRPAAKSEQLSLLPA